MMNLLDEVLRSPDDAPQNPVVRRLESRHAAGDNIRVQLEMDADQLCSSITKLIILRTENEVAQPPEAYDWDEDLNASLITLGIKAVDVQQEGERFARGLRSTLRKVERRYGDGYMNSVLMDLIARSDLASTGEIGNVRKQIHSMPPERSGRSYTDCRDMIAHEIAARAKELSDKLHYSLEDRNAIMDKAIARYLDERFSITSLTKLGWIDENGHTT